jgi:signal transduction histidine kinase
MLEQGVAEPLAPRQRQYVEKSRRSVQAAVRLIEDLLTLARTESGQMELRLVTMDVGEVAACAVEDYRAQAHRKALAIAIDVAAPLPRVRSDPARVGQILGNMISNAIKYTDSGGISVRAGTRADRGGCERIAVDISDTGPGIPEASQELIFQEFQRLDAAQTSGTGIGLAISRGLARALGGDITVVSEPGRGSTFTLWLPFEPAGSANASKHADD